MLYICFLFIVQYSIETKGFDPDLIYYSIYAIIFKISFLSFYK
ncbi:Uncharacterized protein dnl_43710 [Desulfonema limicola]|uniref:Uncharacterized protein n=1 Tax=Desulfonema limicola TaxID=45656 RepID=A0A975BB81_9BACT|nr:Uncharacterized protein dnl_43710 [Desulfonema limicola]